MKVMKGNLLALSTFALNRSYSAEVTDLPELHESDYLRRVLTADPTHPGFRHNLHLLDEFRLQGPNGRHLCLVTELLGERLDQYAKRFPHGKVPMAIIKTLSRQIINAILYLHEKCNIIHTGESWIYFDVALLTRPRRYQKQQCSLHLSGGRLLHGTDC
jgi:serine/threonine protein kinase